MMGYICITSEPSCCVCWYVLTIGVLYRKVNLLQISLLKLQLYYAYILA